MKLKKKVSLWDINLKLEIKRFHVELLARWFTFHFSTFEVLSRSWKIKNFTFFELLIQETKKKSWFWIEILFPLQIWLLKWNITQFRILWKKDYKDHSVAQSINCQYCFYIETSQLICTANQLTGFYMRATLAVIGLSQTKNDPI